MKINKTSQVLGIGNAAIKEAITNANSRRELSESELDEVSGGGFTITITFGKHKQ